MEAVVANASSPGRIAGPWTAPGSRVLRVLQAGRGAVPASDAGRLRSGIEDGLDPINIGEFESRLRGHRDVIRRSLQLFREECRNGSEGLWRCVEARDWSEAAALAHRLKGAAGMVSAVALRSIAAEVESACRAERAEAATLRLVELEREVSRALEQVGRIVEPTN